MKKKKKIRRSKGKKVFLPNDVVPTIVMPITHYDDYDWESNDTCYNLENLFGTNLESCDNNCYNIGAIHIINDESDYAYDMQSPKLGDAMFDESDKFENIFSAINVCPKLGDAMFNEDDF